MADLFDILSGALDLGGELARARREATLPELPPLPPGIPALPPDPRAIAAGFDAIRAHDPGFDEAAFLAHARAVWARVTATAGGIGTPLRDVAISAVRVGPEIETVTVRFGTAGGESDWVFQRSAAATTDPDPATTANHCPNCGAPLQLDPTGECPYCHSSVLAAPGWALTARTMLRPVTERDVRVLAMVAAASAAASASSPAPPPAARDGVDLAALGVDAYSLLAVARETVYAVAQARSQRRPALVAGRVGGALATALDTEAADTAARHRHHVLAFLEVTDAVITAASHAGDGVRVTVRMRLTGQEYELSDGTMDIADGTPTMRSWTEDWVLQQRGGATADWVAISSVRVADGGATSS